MRSLIRAQPFLFALFASLAVWWSSRSGAEESRAPVPDRAAQKAAAERIQSVFEDEYKAADRATKAALAGKLLKLAGSESDKVAQFTLYREAVRFASEAGDVATTLQAVDGMAAKFAISSSAVKLYAFGNIAKTSLPKDETGGAADACAKLASELIAENNFDGAKKAVEYGLAAIRRTRDGERMTRLRRLGDQIDDIAKQYRAVAEHAAALKENPDDPAANLEVGRFECFVKGNWQEGLSHLAKGSDAKLKALAEQTLASPSKAQDQYQVANGWWKQASSRDGVTKDRILAYAGNWYEQALPGLTGLSKATAEKRIAEAPAVAGGPQIAPRQKTINLLELLDPEKDFKPKNKWAITNGVLQCTDGNFVPKVVFPYQPPEEYDVAFVFSQPKFRNGVGLIMPNPNPDLDTSFAFFIAGGDGRVISLSSDGGKYRQRFPQPLVRENVKCGVVFKVRKAGIQVVVNGVLVANLQTDFSDLKVGNWHRVKEWQNLAVCADDPAVFYLIQVTEVTGEGAITRFPKSE